MKKTLAVLVILASTAIGRSDPASAARGYSNADVRGAYTASFDGFVGVNTATSVPIASVGRFVADGAGHLTNGTRTLVAGGTVFRQTFTCDYDVNPDGTGHATCTIRTNGVVTGAETFDFVIESREAGEFIGTTPGVTVLGRIERQDPGSNE